MEFRILGPLEAVDDGRVVSLKAAKPRALLAILLLHANELVPSDRLIEDLWSGRPPVTATKILQTYVSRLRRVLGPDTIVTGPAGYELRLEPQCLDLHRFQQLVAEAQGVDPSIAARALHEALVLWRGPPLADFPYEPWAQAEIRRLEELRLEALEHRIDADLALGRAGELVGELEPLIAGHPLRERPHEQLMLALYRSGRPADALAAYRFARETFVQELGIEPGASLRLLERAILDQDPELDVAPGSASTPMRGRLPSSLRTRSTSFVGRERELREIRQLLREVGTTLLTLTGPAGTGKTRLAVEATVGIESQFPDGVVLVELAPVRDPELVAPAIADTLGVSAKPGRDLVELLVAYLRDRRALLVLDNFEQVLAAAPLLTQLLGVARDLVLLVTSRAPLDVPVERVYPVSALELPDTSLLPHVGRLRQVEAVRLFVDRARDARVDFELSDTNADPIVQLCVRLDGLPLALELAAARIKLLSPGAILTRLGPRLDLIKSEPGSGAPERHRTLRAAIDWSYDLLDAQQQQLFTSLGVFAGGFTLDGAQAVAGELELDIVDGVESLLRNNLLRTERLAGGEPRFGMLETIHEYALDRLGACGNEALVRRSHACFYAELAEDAEPDLRGPHQLRWLELLDAELANIRAALTWATETGDAEVGLRIGAALWRYWQMRGYLGEGRERLERLLALGSGSRAARATGQAAVASIAVNHGDNAEVARLLQKSLPVHRELGDDLWIAGSLSMLCESALVLGDADDALACADEGLAYARRSGDSSTEAMLLHSLGLALGWKGELEAAASAVDESVQISRRDGNLTSVGNWVRSLGSIARARRDHAQARLCFEESLAIGRAIGHPYCISHALSYLALVAQEGNDRAAARRLLAESVAIEREAGERLGLVANLDVYARLATADGRHARAVRLCAGASALRESVGIDACGVGWPDLEPMVVHLRSELGADVFAETWAAGRAMPLEEALDFAVADEGLHAEPASSRRRHT
jgi:predicted ATPase/DNA-binding SARP family transcriptional activator